MKPYFFSVAFLLAGGVSHAHDTWVETNTNLYRVGDCAHIDLKLGNHGNAHRDFKLASKVPLAKVKLELITPGGQKINLKNTLIDTGFTPKEGFWKTTFIARKPGIYTVSHSFDDVMSYAPERAIKNAKTYFLVSQSLDRVPANLTGFSHQSGVGLEFVAESNPVIGMRARAPFKLRLLFKGKPISGVKVSFVPEGETLRGDFDARYEAKTNINGRVSFSPAKGSRYLIVAHHKTSENGHNSAGVKYDFTLYGATLDLYVPQVSLRSKFTK